ncbi:MAG: hypothetical protein ACR2LK_08920 [Solirubrobacteraceae bacterium]
MAVLLGGLATLCAASPALAAPADISVRIEGSSATLVPRTALRTTTAPVNKDGQPGHQCSGTSAAGALELATGGDWGGSWFDAFGYSVERIRGESHVFPSPDYYGIWINNRAAAEGVCGATSELQQGDELLIFVDRCEFDPVTSACSNAPVVPLGLTVPRLVRPGVPFTVSVVEYAADGTSTPAAGATVGGGAAAATTNAAGAAVVTIARPGPAILRATKPGRARSATEGVCASTGSDGACGSAVPGAPSSTPACVTDGRDGLCGTRDRSAPGGQVTGIREQQRFARGKGPRRLRARIDSDPSGLLTVKLRLTRTVGRRCSYFSGRFERLRRSKCGAENGFWFAVGDRERVDYLLPARLPRGRYVLDVNVVDKAYNRDDMRRRGGNRIVFHVR